MAEIVFTITSFSSFINVYIIFFVSKRFGCVMSQKELLTHEKSISREK